MLNELLEEPWISGPHAGSFGFIEDGMLNCRWFIGELV